MTGFRLQFITQIEKYKHTGISCVIKQEELFVINSAVSAEKSSIGKKLIIFVSCIASQTIMSENKILKIGITQGDFNGIGPEVIIKTLADSRMSELMTPVVYGSSKVLSFYKKDIEEAEGFAFHIVNSAQEARPKRVNLVEVTKGDVKVEPGQPTQEAGAAAVAALRAAVKDLKAGAIDALVTAPINKETVHGQDFDFTGHTEFLAAEFEGEPVMVMCSDIMKVGLVTIHIPVAAVSGSISKEQIVRRTEQLRDMLIRDFRIVEPRIAVLALNPHGGDGGLLGKEEQEIIKPAIEEVWNKGILAFGPFPADGFFAAGGFKKYDAVLAMYHDQGLTPFKTLAPSGVNFTASLPAVRTSPDHGVAYDIAGQDKADPSSMREAIYLAIDVCRNRKWHAEISANPLKHYERDRGHDGYVRDLKLPEQTED